MVSLIFVCSNSWCADRVMGTSAELHLRWSSYESTLLMSVSDLWDAGAMTDVTLSAEGRSIKAHKVVLSACSGWFKEVLQVRNNNICHVFVIIK